MPVDFVRAFVVLGNSIKLNNLAEFFDQQSEEVLGVPLRAHRSGDADQRFVTCRG